MNSLLINWFNGHEEQIHLCEGDAEIVMRRYGSTLYLNVQLTQHAPDDWQLQTWMWVGSASLNRFQGALARAPVTGALWLIQCLGADQGEEHLIDSLEAMLNQRDAWQAVAARLASPRKSVPPTSLRSLTY
ncbi:type III secretion protein [Pseudomonas sp. MUP55]|uniref:type III secretion protein n=1 Tax=Pseudomonas sp. MUP55 TaxID=3087234 RepID=UPI002A5A3798|nr:MULTISPECIES: type III secretion protein [unclassified Pseudomonas]WPN93496.1 type III secretion protein [Pseudomonas sp. MUP56]WPN99022.1 type III secretion protein [Pseudomonas sp. MUP55]